MKRFLFISIIPMGNNSIAHSGFVQRIIRVFISISALFLAVFSSYGQCTATYTYSADNESLSFTNNSTVSNAHFYWNFGDGSSSGLENPLHSFPDDGEYLVTLYVHDTISNCSDFYESWISVIKPDTLPCNLSLSYTIVSCASDNDCIVTENLSADCGDYSVDCDVAGGQNGAWNFVIGNGWKPALFVDRLQAYDYDTSGNYVIYEEYYKTVPYEYTASNNYQNCSANFEFYVDYKDTGALVTFKAMNQNATSYTWIITGFGQPIISTTPVTSHFYPYNYYERYFPYLVNLKNYDTNNACGDTVSQQIFIKNPYYGFPLNTSELNKGYLSIFPNPTEGIFELNNASDVKQISIIDVCGKTLRKLDNQTELATIKIDISDFPNGFYNLVLEAETGIKTLKVIKN